MPTVRGYGLLDHVEARVIFVGFADAKNALFRLEGPTVAGQLLAITVGEKRLAIVCAATVEVGAVLAVRRVVDQLAVVSRRKVYH